MANKWPTPTPTGIPLATIGHYTLISSLGEGSLGQVFYALDSSQDPPHPVAVKLLHPYLLSDPQALEELRREAEVLASLKHPNIIGLVEFKLEPDQAYLVTEYAAGGSLADLLRPGPDQPPIPLTPEQVAQYLKQITQALHHAHNLNLVHCDLKPENILLDYNGNIKLADFSLATQVSSWSGLDLLKSDQAWGTPYYAAPEQWEGQIGKVCDIYALGVIIFQLLTGCTPYEGTAQELKEQHCNAPIPLLKDYTPDLRYPLALDEVIAEALAKDPLQRLSSAEQLYTRFVSALDEATVSSVSSAATTFSQAAAAPSNSSSSTSNPSGGPWPASSNSNSSSNLNQWLYTISWGIGLTIIIVFIFIFSSSRPIISWGLSITICIPFFTIFIASKTRSQTTTKASGNPNYPTTTITNNPSYPTTTTAANNSSLLLKWHKGPVSQLFWVWDNSLSISKKYPNRIEPLLYAIASDGEVIRGYAWGHILPSLLHNISRVFVGYTALAPLVNQNLAIASYYNEIYIVDLGSNTPNGTGGVWARGHTDTIHTLVWSPDGQILASGSDDRSVRLWSLTGQPLATLIASTGEIKSVAWSPDSKLVAAGTADGAILIWKATGELIATISGHNSRVNSLAWQNSPSAYLLASASDDQTVCLWDNSSGKAVATLSGHNRSVLSVAWSPDGTKLASSSLDQTIQLWDSQGKLLSTLQGHSGGVTSVAWSPDGKWLASGSTDTTVRLWKQT